MDDDSIPNQPAEPVSIEAAPVDAERRIDWSLLMSGISLAVALSTLIYSIRPAHISATFSQVGLSQKGTIIPITFTNDGGQLGSIDRMALTMKWDEDDSKPVLIPVIVLKNDRLPLFGLPGTKDTDYIESQFGSFSVPAGGSIVKELVFQSVLQKQYILPTCKAIHMDLIMAGGGALDGKSATLFVAIPNAGRSGVDFFQTMEADDYYAALSGVPRSKGNCP